MRPPLQNIIINSLTIAARIFVVVILPHEVLVSPRASQLCTTYAMLKVVQLDALQKDIKRPCLSQDPQPHSILRASIQTIRKVTCMSE